MTQMPSQDSTLKRHFGLISLIAFGIGDILGAGIYVLVGKVVGLMGNGAWISFLVAFVVAAFTGLTYAELASRFPRSAGESVYCLNALKSKMLSYLVGFLVLISGLVSAATVARGFVGYVQPLMPWAPGWGLITAFLIGLAGINYWGIKQSSMANIVCTLVELSGLAIVLFAGMQFLGQVDLLEISAPPGVGVSTALLQGAVLAFYAFIGFEDLVNVAEETHQPSKILPKTILVVLGGALLIYILISMIAVSAVPKEVLGASSAPLMDVVAKGMPNFPQGLFRLIALFAVTNTALINFIMSSRILYGMAREGLMPAGLGKVHAATRTPHVAIVTVLGVALLLGLTGTLTILAQCTSLLLLSVFALMNVSLIALKMGKGTEAAAFRVPMFVPVLGVTLCVGLIFFVKPQAYLIAGGLLLVGLVLKAGTKLFR